MYFLLWRALKKGETDLSAGRHMGALVRLYLAGRGNSLSTDKFLAVHRGRCAIAWVSFLIGLIICGAIWGILWLYQIGPFAT